MRALFHTRMLKGQEVEFLADIGSEYSVMDRHEDVNVHGEQMLLLTIVMAEASGKGTNFWLLPLSKFIFRTRKYFVEQKIQLANAFILDDVNFSEVDGITFDEDVVKALAGIDSIIQLFPTRLKAEDFG